MYWVQYYALGGRVLSSTSHSNLATALQLHGVWLEAYRATPCGRAIRLS